MTRLALFSDIHGVAQALDAVRAAIAAAAPDIIAIAARTASSAWATPWMSEKSARRVISGARTRRG